MADGTTETESLRFNFAYVDGDTNNLTIKNPKSNITTSEITELQQFMRTNNIIVGDKYGGTFGKIQSVTRINERKLHLDINTSQP